MDCVNCKAYIDPSLLNVEQRSDGDGIEINYNCQCCRQEFFAVLMPADFESVD